MNDNINRNGEGVAYGAKTLYMVIMHVNNQLRAPYSQFEHQDCEHVWYMI